MLWKFFWFTVLFYKVLFVILSVVLTEEMIGEVSVIYQIHCIKGHSETEGHDKHLKKSYISEESSIVLAMFNWSIGDVF